MNLDRMEAILKLLQRQRYIGEITVEGEGWRLEARKARGLLPPLEERVPLEEEGPPPPPSRVSIRAGLVGVYRAPAAAPRPGDFVAQGAEVGSIDSLDILNPVTAEEPGYVVKALVEDGDPVEYGQELFLLTPEPLPAEEEE